MNDSQTPVTRARFQVRRAGGVLFLWASGVLTIEAVRDMRQILVCHLDQEPASKVLLNIEATVVALTHEQMATLTEEALRPPVVRAQVGLLVLPRDAGLFPRYIERLTERGRTRLLFESSEEAEVWLGVPIPRPLRLVSQSRQAAAAISMQG